MPPKPIEPMPRANHTCARRSARSSPRIEPVTPAPSGSGTSRQIAIVLRAATTTTIT